MGTCWGKNPKKSGGKKEGFGTPFLYPILILVTGSGETYEKSNHTKREKPGFMKKKGKEQSSSRGNDDIGVPHQEKTREKGGRQERIPWTGKQ